LTRNGSLQKETVHMACNLEITCISLKYGCT